MEDVRQRTGFHSWKSSGSQFMRDRNGKRVKVKHTRGWLCLIRVPRWEWSWERVEGVPDYMCRCRSCGARVGTARELEWVYG